MCKPLLTRNEKGYWCLTSLSAFVFRCTLTTMCLLRERERGVDTFVELTSLP